MDANEIADLLRSRPFSPLQVKLRDGRAFEISRPGLAIVTPTTLAIGLSRKNGSRLAERIVRCAVADIVNVKPMAEASK
jgi:hypothetical protein